MKKLFIILSAVLLSACSNDIVLPHHIKRSIQLCDGVDNISYIIVSASSLDKVVCSDGDIYVIEAARPQNAESPQ